MKEVIEKLAEIENKAQHIIENASSEKLKIEREMKKKRQEYQKELEKEKMQKLDELRKKLDAETIPEIEQIYKKGNETLLETELRFLKEKESMAEDVFRRIIGA